MIEYSGFPLTMPCAITNNFFLSPYVDCIRLCYYSERIFYTLITPVMSSSFLQLLKPAETKFQITKAVMHCHLVTASANMTFTPEVMRVSSQLDEREIPDSLKALFTSNVDTWVAPEDMQRDYPYHLSGFDEEKRPVWVMEFGKWDIVKAIQRSHDYKEQFQKYVDQFLYRILKSIGEHATDEDPVKHLVMIYDMEGFALNQLAAPEAISFHLTTVRRVLGLLKLVHAAYLLNTNYVAMNFVEIIRPLLGADFNKVEIHGTNSHRWIPSLLKQIPRDQLPEWYGGKKDFKPLRVYG